MPASSGGVIVVVVTNSCLRASGHASGPPRRARRCQQRLPRACRAVRGCPFTALRAAANGPAVDPQPPLLTLRRRRGRRHHARDALFQPRVDFSFGAPSLAPPLRPRPRLRPRRTKPAWTARASQPSTPEPALPHAVEAPQGRTEGKPSQPPEGQPNKIDTYRGGDQQWTSPN